MYLKRLEAVVEEKSNLKEQLTKTIEELKGSHSAEIKELTEQYEKERNVMERDHQSVIDQMKTEVCFSNTCYFVFVTISQCLLF